MSRRVDRRRAPFLRSTCFLVLLPRLLTGDARDRLLAFDFLFLPLVNHPPPLLAFLPDFACFFVGRRRLSSALTTPKTARFKSG
jgi:hypothetical protein